MTTQPTPLPPTVAELRNQIEINGFLGDLVRAHDKHDLSGTASVSKHALQFAIDCIKAIRAADPAPVADEAAIEGAMMRLANTARTAGSMGMWHQLNPNQPSECADWEERVHVRASELRGLMRAAPRNDDGRLRKLREFYETRNAYMDDQSKRWHAEGNAHIAAEYRGHLAESHRVIDEIDRLLAESPAGDAVCDMPPGVGPCDTPDGSKVGCVLLRAHLRADEAELVTLRARLQAAEAELDEKAELLDKVIYDAEEFSGKLSDILDKNLVPDGEPLARVKEAIDMLTETILERDKLEAERDKLAADLAAAQKERDVAVTGARDFRAAWEREKRWREDDRAAAKAEGARAVVGALNEALDVLAGVLGEKNSYTAIVDLRDAKLRAAQPQPTTAEPATNGREGDDVLREFLDYSKDFSRDEKLDSGLCALVVLVRRALEGKP